LIARLAILAAIAGSLIAVAEPAYADTTLCSDTAYSVCTSAGYTDHGYSAHSSTRFWGADPGHNCTNYVAYVEAQNGMPQPSFSLGNAWQWGSQAAAGGTLVDGNPAIGAVAWWNANAGGTGALGHVAYVESYTATAITVSEDAAPGGPFDWMVITRGSSRWPSGFIHFRDEAPGANSSEFEVAFNSGTSLWSVGGLGNTDWQLGIEPGTSPSIALLSGGGFEVAFNSGTSLWTVGTAGDTDWQLGVEPGTSPSIAARN
jgi:surface antigen